MAIKQIKVLPHRNHFFSLWIKYIFLATLLLLFSLVLGCLGYHYTMDLGFYDSLLNASMILTGMGPVNFPTTNSGKLFSSFYALYSGIAFLSSVAVLFAPVVQRFLHKFHLDVEE